MCAGMRSRPCVTVPGRAQSPLPLQLDPVLGGVCEVQVAPTRSLCPGRAPSRAHGRPGHWGLGAHQEPTLAIKYDLAVTLVLLVGFGLDYALRIDVADRADGVPDACDLLTRRLWMQFLIQELSYAACPFVLFQLPVLGTLLHGLRPTGYDRSGCVRLKMTIDDARKKFEAELAARSKGEKAPGEGSSSSPLRNPLSLMRKPKGDGGGGGAADKAMV